MAGFIDLGLDCAALGKELETAQAPTAIKDLEGATRLFNACHVKVLENTARFEIGSELQDLEQIIGLLTDVHRQ